MFKMIKIRSLSIFLFILIVIGAIGLWYFQKDKISCEMLGGKWQSIDSPDNRHICNLPTADGGKECSDSSQCESFCQAKEGTERGQQTTGQCHGWKTSITPCFTTVNNGISEAPSCY